MDLSKFTPGGVIPQLPVFGQYQRLAFGEGSPSVKLQSWSQFVPTALTDSVINIESRNSLLSGFRWKHTSKSTDTNNFGSFKFQSFVSDSDGTDIWGFDGTDFNIYFPVSLNSDLDMGGSKIINLGTPTLATDATNKTYVDGSITGASIVLTGNVTGSGHPGTSIATTIVSRLNQIPVATSAVDINSQNITDVGNLGVGVSSPTFPLHFPNVTANCKICLYSSLGNSFQLYGFGVTANTLKYTVDSSASSHVFYCGASSTTSTELFRIAGTGYATVSGGDGTFYSRVPSACVVITFNGSGTSCTAGTWRKPVGTTIPLTGAVQFTTAVSNRIVFTGSDLSAACTGMASACATFALGSYVGVTAQMGLAIYKNGTTVVGIQTFSTFSGGPISIAIPNIMTSLSPTDYLELWIMCNTTMSVTLQEMSLSFMAC